MASLLQVFIWPTVKTSVITVSTVFCPKSCYLQLEHICQHLSQRYTFDAATHFKLICRKLTFSFLCVDLGYNTLVESHMLCYKLLLLGSVQLRAVYPFPNAKDVFCHIFFHVSASNEVRHLVFPWFLRSSSSPSILRRCTYHYNCLLWILSKIDCSSCILLLMMVFEYFLQSEHSSWPP